MQVDDQELSPLRSDNISGNFIFILAFVAAPTLVRTKSFHLLSQTARLLESPTGAFIAAQPQGRSKHIFTGGGVTANGICCRWLPAGERTLSGASRQLSRRESQGRNGSASCLSLWERWLRPSGADGEGAPAPLRGAAAAAAEGPSNRRSEKKVQRRRPPPAADTGRSCWGSGLQDASASQGTKQTQGAATRRLQRVEIAATLPR